MMARERIFQWKTLMSFSMFLGLGFGNPMIILKRSSCCCLLRDIVTGWNLWSHKQKERKKGGEKKKKKEKEEKERKHEKNYPSRFLRILFFCSELNLRPISFSRSCRQSTLVKK